MPGRNAAIKVAALLVMVAFSAAVWAQQPVTGYAPVNGLKMYYEIHGMGEPVVLLHGATRSWATCGRAARRAWPSCPIRPTSR
jgi:hypothetical protein